MENYKIIHNFGYELWYRETLLFVTPCMAVVNEYLNWRLED